MLVNVISSTARLIIGIPLVLIGLKAMGITLGYLIPLIVTFGIYTMFSMKWGLIGRLKISWGYGELLKSGAVSWIPGLAATLGASLGVVAVFGYQGSFQAGLYFIAYAVASIILAIPSSLLGIMFPVLSGMKDGRKRTAWRAIKISLAITAPIATALAVYGNVVLGLFRPEYSGAWLVLIILLAGVAPDAIISGVNILAYAYGMYGLVLAIGLAMNIPRVLFYLTLTPIWGGNGAASAFLMGTISGVCLAAFIAKRIKLRVNWYETGIVLSAPFIIGTSIYFTHIPWFIGIIVILTLPTIIYVRLKIISKEDVRDLAEAFLPKKILNIGIQKFGWVLEILFS
jgi:O-antigen/teichoic acid export membrane protein